MSLSDGTLKVSLAQAKSALLGVLKMDMNGAPSQIALLIAETDAHTVQEKEGGQQKKGLDR